MEQQGTPKKRLAKSPKVQSNFDLYAHNLNRAENWFVGFRMEVDEEAEEQTDLLSEDLTISAFAIIYFLFAVRHPLHLGLVVWNNLFLYRKI